jgi:hypothetical protein
MIHRSVPRPTLFQLGEPVAEGLHGLAHVP